MGNDFTNWLPLEFSHWLPWQQALTLALLTLASEDATTIGSALLVQAGGLAWAPAFWGCLLGIWLGDLGLYALARGIGRPLLERPWAARWVSPEGIQRSEVWFARRGIWVVLLSRIIPGTRLPTYLAAGFLRVSLVNFALATLVAVSLWTWAIFALAEKVGKEALTWLRQWNLGGWAILLVAVFLWVAIRFGLWFAQGNCRARLGGLIGRWTRWEFWPPWMFYPPLVIYVLWLSLRYRGFSLPTLANPGIFAGGVVGESKIETLADLTRTSPEFTAAAFLVTGETLEERLASLAAIRTREGLEFPFILKPDYGQRGVGVKLVRTEEHIRECLQYLSAPWIAQCYAPGPLEAGVFYYRLPHEPRGHIFAITDKIFPVLTGDGQRTLEELIWADERARCMAHVYLKKWRARATENIPAGEKIRLVQAGNHAQGCIFQDGMHLCTEALTQRIDEISQRLNGFFIGRYDVRYADAADLQAGKNFQILELNGATAEATSIYDARNSLFTAYRTLFAQWRLVFAIGAANRVRGVKPLSVWTVWRAWRENSARARSYPVAD